MARALRIEYKRALYHILSRGNQGQYIFLNDSDCASFLNLLDEMSERFDISIFSYVLMGNHYHLLLRTNRANLSKAMQWLGTTYTRRFNLRNDLTGHLFQGRFKSILVQNDAYLMQLSCYIHRNPLRAGLVKRLADFRWSSYHFYAYKKKPPLWLDTKLILSQFNAEDPHRTYREKVHKYAKEEERIWENLRHGLIYGTKKFVEKIKSSHLAKEADDELPQLNRILKDKEPEDLVIKAAQILRCKIDTFKQAKRISNKDLANRDVLLYFLHETGLYTNRQIGKLLGLGYSAVSRRANLAKLELSKNPEMQHGYQRLKSIIKV